ncbi:MAG: FKBP-type peptidyl-prolyl cis-trans isomerase N-terminal domain-containing protein [Rikenellaceae bacterium]
MKKIIYAAVVAGAMVAASCSSNQTTITEGSASKFDSLSYALGANIAFSVGSNMQDIPLNYESIAEGLNAAAFDKSKMTQEGAVEILQDYFMNKRAARAQEVEAKRQEADEAQFEAGADTATVMAARAALPADPAMFESEEERNNVSYAFGVDLGSNIKSAEIPVQTYWINQAMVDVHEDKPQMNMTAANAYLNNYFSIVRPAEMAKVSAENLAKIEKQSGVVKTESGLLYRVEKAGDANVQATSDEDVVKVFYTGKLIRNDKVFDTNRFADRSAEEQEAMKAQNPAVAEADEPIEFPLNRVIPGWTEGMKFVGKGGRISLWIPAELAYGAQGAGRDIGPNEALYFDVEIVDVTPAQTAAPVPAE